MKKIYSNLNLIKILNISPFLLNYFKNNNYIFFNLNLGFITSNFYFNIFSSNGLIFNSFFKKFLNQPIKILKYDNYIYYNSTQIFNSFNISKCYFKNINTINSGGSFFISNINIDVYVNNCYFENILSYGSSTNPNGRANCGGGGFCVFSSKCFFKFLCFLNCSSNFVGPSFHSCSNNNQNNEFNYSTLLKTFTNLHNSWSEDRGIIINNEINNSNSITLDALTMGHRSTFNSALNKYIIITNCSSNKFIIGDSGISSSPSNYQYCNIISNYYSNSLFNKYNNCIHIFNNCHFINNPIGALISSSGTSTFSFYECFGDFILNSLTETKINCSFNNQKNGYDLSLNYCFLNINYTQLNIKSYVFLKNILFFYISFIF